MGVYCISDVHGCFDKFQNMLQLINFQDSDQLYILGDIIDRGPQSAEMLWYATEEAPANVHFLLGNHEDMLLAGNYYNRDEIYCRYHDPWAWNGGLDTVTQIREFNKYYSGWEKRIIDWVDSLPLYFDIEVNNKRFILVHAALQSKPDFPDDQAWEGKHFLINIDGMPCPQDTQAMLWNRKSWLNDNFEWPCDIITGHTPIMYAFVGMFKEVGIEAQQNEDFGILHFGPGLRKHIIDCGVNKSGKLACLRLDDMKEFYVGSD